MSMISKKVAGAVKGATSFVADKGNELSEKKRRWYILLNEGLEGTWAENSRLIINAARKLGIKCAHVISGAGDISAVGAHCNFEELQKLLDVLGMEMDAVGLANAGEAYLFEHNIVK